MTDLVILNYIIDAICSDTMEHIVSDGIQYVWINRDKLLNDLPILGISSNRLSHLLDKLKTLGLIQTKQFSIKGTRGSKSYITVTDLLISCLNSECDQYFSLLGVKNNTSNITIDNINNINNINLSEVLKITPNTEKVSNDLYSKCARAIYSYFEDKNLQDLLFEYLSVRLSIKDKPLGGVNQWIGLLKLLSQINRKEDAIRASIKNRWATFVDPDKRNNFGGQRQDVFSEYGVVSNQKSRGEVVQGVLF